jgi:hypothetical protein
LQGKSAERGQKTLAVDIPYRASKRSLHLLGQIPGDEQIGSVTKDRACDIRKCHDAIVDCGADTVIPPRKNAKPWNIATAGVVARNEALRASKYLGRALWRQMERIPPPMPRRSHLSCSISSRNALSVSGCAV